VFQNRRALGGKRKKQRPTGRDARSKFRRLIGHFLQVAVFGKFL